MVATVIYVIATLGTLAAATVLLCQRRKRTGSVQSESNFSADYRREVAETAAKDSAHNYLLTGAGKVYKNPTPYTHVEEIFIR